MLGGTVPSIQDPKAREATRNIISCVSIVPFEVIPRLNWPMQGPPSPIVQIVDSSHKTVDRRDMSTTRSSSSSGPLNQSRWETTKYLSKTGGSCAWVHHDRTTLRTHVMVQGNASLSCTAPGLPGADRSASQSKRMVLIQRHWRNPRL